MNMSLHSITMTEDGMAHPHDPAKQSEHIALLDLVPHHQATHVAVKNGSWFDASTWANGQVPGDGARVVIADGITVDYDGVSDASLFTLRVDGRLDFATDQNTQIKLDTFVVSPSGTLTIGSELNPVQSHVETRIIIADNGAIDTRWDPKQLSRGIISHGMVEIHGAEKTTHLKLAQDAMAGDDRLVLAEVPEGWQVGDRLVLTGTRYVKDQWNGSRMVWQGTQDEELTIKDIQGNTVILEESLQYDHDTPRGSLKASVANYSRNVVIETENFENLPANQRGHVMFMHSDAVDVRYVEFHELGRTDKSKLLDDFKLDSSGNRILDANGDPIANDADDINNQRGRYAVHFHRTGVDDIQGEAAIAIGNAVWGSPGWGYVHHDSHLILEDNAAYNVFGSAFVTETGNEIGAWRNNIAIKSEGMRSISKSGKRVNNHDIAHNGTGFWFQGRLVENEGNIAAGQRHAGITYLLRGVDQADVLAENLDNPEIARYDDTMRTGKPPIQGFQDNEVMASGMGLEVVKANPRQGHEVRSVIDGFTAWEVRTGTHMEYTSKYTLKDITVIGAESGASSGISFGNNAEDMTVNQAHVEGFKTGVKFKKNHTFADFNGDWQYALIDTRLVNNDKDYENLDPAQDQVLTSRDLVSGRLQFTPDANADFVLSPSQSDRQVVITGTKIDSLGAIELPTGSDSLKFNFHQGLKQRLQEGYFIDSKGTRFFTVEELFADRATGELLKQEYVVTLTDDWNEFTLGGTLKDVPVLGTYSGVVQPGVMSTDLGTWIEQQVGTSKGGQHTHAEGATDATSPKGPCPVTGGPVCNCGKKNQQPDSDENTDPGPDAGPDSGSDAGSDAGPGTPPSGPGSDPGSDSGSDLNPSSGGESEAPAPGSEARSLFFEAEDLELDGYRVETVRDSGASGGKHLSLRGVAGGQGSASGVFAGEAGTYQLKIHYFDESDGQSNITVAVAGESRSLKLDKDLPNNWAKPASLTSEVTHEAIALKPGDRFSISGERNRGEYARIDAIEFIPLKVAPESEESSNPAAASSPPQESSGIGAIAALDLTELTPYGGNRQNKGLQTILSEDGTAIRMAGNGWKKLDINYTITPETMLKLEFRSTAQGEIHTIGFDTDNRVKDSDQKTSFKLFGVQDWGIDDFANYLAQDGWQTVEIPVGDYFTGDMAYLTLGNDHDVVNPTAESEFRNILLYEASEGIGQSSPGEDGGLNGAKLSAKLSDGMVVDPSASRMPSEMALL